MIEIVYNCLWFDVIKDHNWHFIAEKNSNNGAVILVLKDDKKFIFIKNYRRAINAIEIELPRGYGEEGEDSFSSAIRECYEETGFKVAKSNIKKIGTIHPNSAILASSVDVFFATVVESDRKKTHDNEVLDVIEIAKDELMEKIVDGSVKDSFSLSAIALYTAQCRINNK